MKIHSIKYKGTTSQPASYDIVEENINTLSSARLVLSLDITDDVNNNINYNINGDIHKKWRLNSYGVPSLLSKINKLSNVNLDYFTISSNITDINDYDSIEYAGLQLGEIENSYFSKLLCYDSGIAATFSSSSSVNGLQKIFDRIQKQEEKMYSYHLQPKFIICDSFSFLKIFSYHPTFKTVSNDYKPHVGNIILSKEPVYIILNNLMGNDVYSNICLCADLIGPMHIKGGLKNWSDQNNIVFTETIGMAILEEKGVNRFVLEK